MPRFTASLAVWCCVGLASFAAADEDLDALNARVAELYRTGDYAEAVKVAEQAVNVAERQFGNEAAETATPINNLALLYQAQARHAQAEPLYQRALAIREKTLGPDHPDTARSLSNLAFLYSAQGRYAQAESLYQRALAIFEKTVGPDHLDTGVSLNDLGFLYSAQGRYAQAALLYQRSLAIHENTLGPDHPHTAVSLNNLAALYFDQGQYAQAEPLYQRAIVIREKTLGPDHPDTAMSLNNLAMLYLNQGQHTLAEPLFKRAMAVEEKTLGLDHPATAVSLSNLALLYFNQGQYAQAEPLYQRVFAIREKALGPDHPDTAASLNNLAGLYDAQGDYARAEPLLQQALAIREKALGPDHPATATSLNNLAAIYEHRGQYALAEPLYKRAMVVHEKNPAKDPQDKAISLNNLAGLYGDQGKYAQAEPLYRRALAIREKSVGPYHPDTVLILSNIAVLEAALGRFTDAAMFIDRSRRGVRRHVSRVLPSLSAAEQAVFLRRQDEAAFHRALSFGLLQKADAAISSLSAGWLCNGKAVGQEAASQRIILARQSKNPATVSTAVALERVRADLSRLAQVTPTAQQAAAYRGKLSALQADERRLIHEIGGQLAVLDREEPWVEIDEIRNNIGTGSVLVDIARFDCFDFSAMGTGKKWQLARYAAWIVPPAGGGDVQIVDLGDAAEIDGLVADYRRSIDARHVDVPAAEPLAEKVIRPILAVLASRGKSVEEVILSPDGPLWLVPWQALPLEDGSFAIERYSIRTVTSARDLVPPPADAAPRELPSMPLVVADPAFDEPPKGVDASGQPAAGEPVASLSVDRLLGKVAPLPGTRREAEAARAPLARVAGVTPAVRVGRDATAAAVQREAVRPKVLVLATHGFFLPDQEVKRDERTMLAGTRGIAGTRPLDTATGKPVQDPLLRCGLLFAGANLPSAQVPADDDGVLTGAEIVGLDLLGTELVVLSACETGIGRVNVGEGVAGLRQSFQIAGAKSVVATLWQVPDEESGEIMSAFYANLADGKAASRALRQAQLAFIKQRREAGGAAAAHPYLWAAYGATGR